MPYLRIWIHAVWSTKNRKKLLPGEIRNTVFNHIYQNAVDKEILVDCVNGYLEHVHCLFRLRNDQSISKVMQLIKGESSYWINRNNLTKERFAWQEEYYAVSVSESQVGRVRNYIHRQEEHHKKESFVQEYEQFVKEYGFQISDDNS